MMYWDICASPCVKKRRYEMVRGSLYSHSVEIFKTVACELTENKLHLNRIQANAQGYKKFYSKFYTVLATYNLKVTELRIAISKYFNTFTILCNTTFYFHGFINSISILIIQKRFVSNWPHITPCNTHPGK